MSVPCAAPACTDPMVRCVGWLPFCAPHADFAETTPGAVEAIAAKLPARPVNYAREDAEMAEAERRAEIRRWGE